MDVEAEQPLNQQKKSKRSNEKKDLHKEHPEENGKNWVWVESNVRHNFADIKISFFDCFLELQYCKEIVGSM